MESRYPTQPDVDGNDSDENPLAKLEDNDNNSEEQLIPEAKKPRPPLGQTKGKFKPSKLHDFLRTYYFRQFQEEQKEAEQKKNDREVQHNGETFKIQGDSEDEDDEQNNPFIEFIKHHEDEETRQFYLRFLKDSGAD